MFVNPHRVVAEGWVTGITNPEKQIQPNAIDFTLDKLFRIDHNTFVINEQGKRMRDCIEVTDQVDGHFYGLDGQFWKLEQSYVYDGMSSMYVRVPEGYAAFLIVRSSFNRNGIQIASGLYDSGFEGHIGFAIYPRIACNLIAPGTRIGQIVFVEAQNAGLYEGRYNHKEGTYETDGRTHTDRPTPPPGRILGEGENPKKKQENKNGKK